MSIENLPWSEKNPYMLEIKTAEQGKEFIRKGGVGLVQCRMESVFLSRLSALKNKITLLHLHIESDALYSTLTDAILVDCRALFLESRKLKRNATLQNIYHARMMPEKANKIDNIFNSEILPGKNLKDVIKEWVDKRIVHVDWMWDDDELQAYENIQKLILGDGMLSIFDRIKELIDEYEEVTKLHGNNFREQLDQILEFMTGD